ncbi:MAG: hypothetical protein R2697_21545 [Ilumatobacteraceae bacterium]
MLWRELLAVVVQVDRRVARRPVADAFDLDRERLLLGQEPLGLSVGGHALDAQHLAVGVGPVEFEGDDVTRAGSSPVKRGRLRRAAVRDVGDDGRVEAVLGELFDRLIELGTSVAIRSQNMIPASWAVVRRA